MKTVNFIRKIIGAVRRSLSLKTCKGQPTGKIHPITVQELNKILNKDLQLIDVRTPEEFSELNIKGAVNIDFFSDDFEQKVQQLNKQQPVYVYCRSGKRSYKAAQKFETLGFTQIYDLKGGSTDWQKEYRRY